MKSHNTTLSVKFILQIVVYVPVLDTRGKHVPESKLMGIYSGEGWGGETRKK